MHRNVWMGGQRLVHAMRDEMDGYLLLHQIRGQRGVGLVHTADLMEASSDQHPGSGGPSWILAQSESRTLARSAAIG